MNIMSFISKQNALLPKYKLIFNSICGQHKTKEISFLFLEWTLSSLKNINVTDDFDIIIEF